MSRLPHKRTGDEQGFTLPEVLVVMAVISLLAGISAGMFHPVISGTEKRLFKSQFAADMYFAQAYALNRKEVVAVHFVPSQNSYRVRANREKKVLINRELPGTIKMLSANMTVLHYNPDGNTGHFGTVRFQQGDRKITATFYIGKGRFIVEEG